MNRERLRKLLEEVRRGRVGVDEALDRLRLAPLEDLGFAKLDLHRELRRGFPEVIFGPGKTAAQILTLAGRLHEAGQTVVVTRVGADVHAAVAEAFPRAEYHEVAAMIVLRCGPPRRPLPGVVVFTAGTSDIAVAEEAAVTAEVMGCGVERVYDVGVAGLHRLLVHRDTLLAARVAVVVAGMEGALPSVIAGLTDCPVVGVPASSGYGTGDGGRAALMAMLNSCSAGLTVVNVDNGFGAGYAAALINRARRPRSRPPRSGGGRKN